MFLSTFFQQNMTHTNCFATQEDTRRRPALQPYPLLQFFDKTTPSLGLSEVEFVRSLSFCFLAEELAVPLPSAPCQHDLHTHLQSPQSAHLHFAWLKEHIYLYI